MSDRGKVIVMIALRQMCSLISVLVAVAAGMLWSGPATAADASCLPGVLKSRLAQIRKKFGNRDHTTVLHAVKQIEKLCEEDRSLAEDVAALKRRLAG